MELMLPDTRSYEPNRDQCAVIQRAVMRATFAWSESMSQSLEAVNVTFFSSRGRHTIYWRYWSSDVCSSDLTGVNERLGYESPADIAEHYPAFFWGRVEPFIQEAIGYLDLTVEGRQWVATLYSHVFAMEHDKIGRATCRDRG